MYNAKKQNLWNKNSGVQNIEEGTQKKRTLRGIPTSGIQGVSWIPGLEWFVFFPISTPFYSFLLLLSFSFVSLSL